MSFGTLPTSRQKLRVGRVPDLLGLPGIRKDQVGHGLHHHRRHDDNDDDDQKPKTYASGWRPIAEPPLWAPTWAITQPALSTCCSSS